MASSPAVDEAQSSPSSSVQASKALLQCSAVKDLIATAADTILHPIHRTQAMASILLDLSQDPEKAPAAYQEYCVINSEEAANSLCAWIEEELELPDAAKAQADIDAKAEAKAEVQRQADAEVKESKRLYKAWTKAYSTYERHINDYPADQMSFGYWSKSDAVDLARRQYNTFHGIVDEQDSKNTHSDSTEDTDSGCDAAQASAEDVSNLACDVECDSAAE